MAPSSYLSSECDSLFHISLKMDDVKQNAIVGVPQSTALMPKGCLSEPAEQSCDSPAVSLESHAQGVYLCRYIAIQTVHQSEHGIQ